MSFRINVEYMHVETLVAISNDLGRQMAYGGFSQMYLDEIASNYWLLCRMISRDSGEEYLTANVVALIDV